MEAQEKKYKVKIKTINYFNEVVKNKEYHESIRKQLYNLHLESYRVTETGFEERKHFNNGFMKNKFYIIATKDITYEMSYVIDNYKEIILDNIVDNLKNNQELIAVGFTNYEEHNLTIEDFWIIKEIK